MKLMSDSLDTIGVIARTVADCALFAGAISGRELGNPDRQPDTTPRIGICRSPVWDKALPETQQLLPRVATALDRAGARLEDRELPGLFNELIGAHPVIMNSESARSLGWELATAREQISPELLERLEFGLSRDEATLVSAYDIFARTGAAFPEAMSGLDVLVTPSAPGEAPEGLGWTGDPVFNFIWTSLGVPCVTVPAGTGPNGLPLGIQIVGRAGADRSVLAWAAWVAAALT